MAYSEAAPDGVRDNGREWRSRVHGVRPNVLRIVEIYDRGMTMSDVAEVTEAMRSIANRFRCAMKDEAERYDAALEWLESDSPAYEIERHCIEDWHSNWVYYMGELYDWADYNRALICD